MKFLLLVSVLFAVAVIGTLASLAGSISVLGRTLYFRPNFLSVYQGNPNFPDEPDLPFVDEDRLCFLVGVLSGCSGCELGTEGLCSWVDAELYGSINNDGNHYLTCAPTTFVTDLLDLGQAVGYKFHNASHQCPSDAKKAPIIRSSLVDHFTGGELSIEEVSLIHNTFHEMRFGEVPYKPWPVDRTALHSRLGALRLSPTQNLYLVTIGQATDCDTVNSEELLLRGDSPLINAFIEGALITPRDAYCLRGALGSLLSTHCPEYGVAYSGISYSLFVSFLQSCAVSNDLNLGPSTISVGLVSLSSTTFGYNVVPDDTPWAIHSIPIWPSGELEHLLNIDEVTLDNEDPVQVFDV